MWENTAIDYNDVRSVYLANTTNNKGYNYTGYSSGVADTLGGFNGTNITLISGQSIGMWDNSTYEWKHFISWHELNTAVAIERWDVMETKVSQTRTFTV